MQIEDERVVWTREYQNHFALKFQAKIEKARWIEQKAQAEMPTSSWPRLFLAAIGLVFSIPGSTNHAPALHTISLLLPPTLAEFDSRWSTRHRCLFCPLFVIFLSAFCTYTAWQEGGGGEVFEQANDRCDSMKREKLKLHGFASVATFS